MLIASGILSHDYVCSWYWIGSPLHLNLNLACRYSISKKDTRFFYFRYNFKVFKFWLVEHQQLSLLYLDKRTISQVYICQKQFA